MITEALNMALTRAHIDVPEVVGRLSGLGTKGKLDSDDILPVALGALIGLIPGITGYKLLTSKGKPLSQEEIDKEGPDILETLFIDPSKPRRTISEEEFNSVGRFSLLFFPIIGAISGYVIANDL